MKKILSVMFLLTFIVLSVSSQVITGKVLNKNTKEPVFNASITVVESGIYTFTDDKGKFSIKAKADENIEIRHISFRTLLVKAKELLTIELIPSDINLDEIIVKSLPFDDISHSIVITDKIKKGSQPRNLADLFNDIPGFSLQKRSSMALEPSFRSFKYEEMNIKYDGISKVVHACPNRMDPITAHVIPEEVNKIEIIKGPFTVRYGQRFGATVNLVTKGVKPNSFGFHGSIEGGYETNGTNLLGRAQLQYASKKFDVALNGENRDFGNYIDGDGTEVPSSFTTQSYSVKLGVNPTENQRLQFDFRQKFGKDIKHSGLPMDSPKDDSYLMGLDYKVKDISTKIKSLLFKGYYSDVDHLMDNALRPNFNTLYARTPVVSSTMGGKLELGITPSDKLLVYAGLDADIIKRDGKKYVTVKKNPAGVTLDPPIEKVFNVWHDATSQDLGVFVEGNYKLASNLSANAGIRVDLVSSGIDDPDLGFENLYGGQIDDISETNIGGNVSLIYKQNNMQIQMAYGRGTRSPSMIERYIYKFTIGSDSRSYIGNPNLIPEINNQFELSLAKHFSNISVGSSVFYSIMNDYITAKVNPEFGTGNPTTDPKQFVNVDAYQYGFDAFVAYNIIESLKFSADIAYTHAQNTSFDEPLAQIAPLSSHLGLKWEKEKYWLDLRTRISAKQDRFSSSFNETETPGYTILDFRAGIKPLKNLTIGAAAMNIFDKVYYSHLNFSYINANENAGKVYDPGRSFSAYVKYKF